MKFASLIVVAQATVFLDESFQSKELHSRWIQSEHDTDYGKFILDSGKYYGDQEDARGLKTSEDSHFYAISAKLDKSFSTEGKDTIIQFSVKHEQNIDCGGGYIKVYSSDFDAKDMHGKTEYNIMFGPDICGATKKVHVILNYKGKHHESKRGGGEAKTDQLSHLYTLILKKNQTYTTLIDNKVVESGNFLTDFDFLPPKTIPDPTQPKPSDWVDE